LKFCDKAFPLITSAWFDDSDVLELDVELFSVGLNFGTLT
jgi:hypothetical protein